VGIKWSEIILNKEQGMSNVEVGFPNHHSNMVVKDSLINIKIYQLNLLEVKYDNIEQGTRNVEL